ncbi:hypothetical protein D9756_008653 [Leucocoprinus leucothites]|uniref:D-lactate dehydratase n=1 Tax=Leucocoprinus leucothites TaxID=201217 RepID=A0A8H5FVF4_9AGAR|nr:hypothetical protein D9756_008653 [Leucoagaricus leucothites]
MPSTSANPKALVLIADGTEEMEFTITYDTLVRGGFDTTSAFVDTFRAQTGSQPERKAVSDNLAVATCSRGVKIIADTVFEAEGASEKFGPDKFDLLVIPGGMIGAKTLSDKKSGVPKLVREYLDKDKYVGMICAGSLAAKSAELPRQPLTSHPSVKEELESSFDYSEESVVISGKLVTTRGPGSTFPFALTLVELIQGKDKRKEISPPMMFPPQTPW